MKAWIGILGALVILPAAASAQKCPTNPYIKPGEPCPPAVPQATSSSPPPAPAAAATAPTDNPAAPTAAHSTRFPDLAPNVTITPPGPDVPGEYAAFSGLWSGKWGGELPSLLIVENISPTGDVTGTYVWDDSPRGNFQGGSMSFRGEIDDGVLGWGDRRVGTYTRFEFEMVGPNQINGRRLVWDSQRGSVTMTKEM